MLHSDAPNMPRATSKAYFAPVSPYARGVIGQTYFRDKCTSVVAELRISVAETGLGDNARDDFFWSEFVDVDDVAGDRRIKRFARAVQITQ
jgi:hypothetical protein